MAMARATGRFVQHWRKNQNGRAALMANLVSTWFGVGFTPLAGASTKNVPLSEDGFGDCCLARLRIVKVEKWG